jgi:hypothetical protein
MGLYVCLSVVWVHFMSSQVNCYFPCQHSHSRFQFPQYSWPYFTVSRLWESCYSLSSCFSGTYTKTVFVCLMMMMAFAGTVILGSESKGSGSFPDSQHSVCWPVSCLYNFEADSREETTCKSWTHHFLCSPSCSKGK